MMEIFKNLDQSRKSFYINNLKKHNYSFQCEIDNFNNIDDFLFLFKKNGDKLFDFLHKQLNINFLLRGENLTHLLLILLLLCVQLSLTEKSIELSQTDLLVLPDLEVLDIKSDGVRSVLHAA